MKIYKMTDKPHQNMAGFTSKGNQWKWKEKGYWYKANQFGFEGIAESLVTNILDMVDVPFGYVRYEPVKISYDNNILDGCRSEDLYKTFTNLNKYEIVPLEKLYQIHTGNSLARNLARISECEERIAYTLDFVKHITGLENFDDYLSFLIQADAFFLNEDRHMNNIAVMWNPDTDKYDYCPYFDFGLSLFSDISNDYPLNMDCLECLKKIQAKPFSVDYDEQLDAVEKISGKRFYIPMSSSILRQNVEKFLEGCSVEEGISGRIIDALSYQMSKYLYMIER